MIKIEGETGIMFDNLLNKVQKGFEFKTKKEALKVVVKTLCTTDVRIHLLDHIEQSQVKKFNIASQELPKKEEDEYPEELNDAHCCSYNADGMCEICGAIRYDSPLYREIYGGE